MPQIFHHSANTIARMSIVGAVAAVAFIGWAGSQLDRSNYTSRASQPREQPVPFSHAHHVGGLGIDCRYCHTTVETSDSPIFRPPRPA